MGARARPGPIPWLRGQAGPHGIQVDVAQGGDEMRLVQWAGEEAVLPELSGAAIRAIERQSVLGVHASQGAGERILALGHGYEMDMVGHHAVAQEACAGARGVMAEKVQVETAMVRR